MNQLEPINFEDHETFSLIYFASLHDSYKYHFNDHGRDNG